MQLDRWQRLRVAALRPLARWLRASPRLRRRLEASEQATLDRGLDRDLALLAALDRRTGDSQVWTRGPAAARRAMRTGIALVDDPGHQLAVVTRDLTVAGAVGLRAARVYAPTDLPAIAPGLVFFHGGGWVTGDLDTHDAVCRKLAALGRLRVIAVDYRLAPEHPYPAAADDAIAAFRAVAARADELGLDRTRLAVGGDSAGGNLSAVIAQACRDDAVAPALQVLLYPAVDFAGSYPSQVDNAEAFVLSAKSIAWYRGHYLGPSPTAATLREPRVSPGCAPDLVGLAPAYVVTAGFDPLRDEARAYTARLRAAGVSVVERDHPSLVHGFLLLTALAPACAAATDATCAEVGALLRGDVATVTPRQTAARRD